MYSEIVSHMRNIAAGIWDEYLMFLPGCHSPRALDRLPGRSGAIRRDLHGTCGSPSDASEYNGIAWRSHSLITHLPITI